MSLKMKLKQRYIAVRYLMAKDALNIFQAIKEYKRLQTRGAGRAR